MARFRARARTVDMLGRQQIAGAATAISELFKNAHDAYARRVEVDYYRPEKLFLLRDDGIGMTHDEFVGRWLTLGTESKLASSGPQYRPDGMEQRPTMGEKGIGRLAIARIGPQVLVMTRARRGDELHDLVVALVNWELFEIPGINLDEIEVPVETVPNGQLPDAAMVRRMADQAKAALHSLTTTIPRDRIIQIERSLDQFVSDPRRIDAFFTTGGAATPAEEPLSLRGLGSGTHFLIQPADSFLAEEIDRDAKGGDPVFTKFIVGFAHAMAPDSPPPKVVTRFRDWKTIEASDELISGSNFFEPSDFVGADHHFSGVFDEFGQFSGTVKVYEQEPVQHTIPWMAGSGPTLCGPFRINVAYLQGESRRSRLPPDEYERLASKLDRFGGIYVFRDGIRILPYGNSDVDWVGIEDRRTRSASYYFFSYRRMFGAVELTRADNHELIEKAGREGFQTNRAYRELTQILENFFIQLAADFFREGGSKADVWDQRRVELERAAKARRKREEGTAARKRAFKEALQTFFERHERSEAQLDVETLFADVQNALMTARQENDPDRAAELLLETETFADSRIQELREKYTISKPREIGIGTELRRDWEAYQQDRKRLEVDVFGPAEERCRETIGTLASEARLQMDQRKRLQKLIGDMAAEVERGIRQRSSEVNTAADERLTEVRQLARQALAQVSDAITAVKVDLQRAELTGQSVKQVEVRRKELEARIDEVARSHREILENAKQQLLEMRFTPEKGEQFVITEGEMAGALEEENLALKEEAEAQTELVQLGMALAVVNHEFDAAIRSIRGELRRFKGWADATPQLRPIYNRITANFEHLDGYLALFTPLQRRLYRKSQRISGSEIKKFLDDLFGERLKRHTIEMTATAAFRGHCVEGFPSSFYPVFVNLIDNALFWLKDRRAPRAITLDSGGAGFLIANNGPAIASRDQTAIFELGFTRKPGGRGMGLYIAKRTLSKIGFDLTLESSSEHPVCFKIAPLPAASKD